MAGSQHPHLRSQIQAIAEQLSKLTIACNIELDQQELWKRILQNDSSVCGRRNDKAFQQIRRHLMALFPLEEEAIASIGANATEEVLDEVRASIAKLRLAGSPSARLPAKFKK